MSLSEQKYSNNSTLGTNNYKPLDQIITTSAEEIKSLLGSWSGQGIVKSVQRGTTTIKDEYDDIIVNINSVNVNKSIVLIQGFGSREETIDGGITGSDSNFMVPVSIIVKDFTSTKITMGFSQSEGPSLYTGTSLSWQVIEFY